MIIRAVNPDVTGRTILVSHRRLVVEVGQVGRVYPVRVAVALKAELARLAADKHARVARAVRLVAGRAAFQAQRRVLVNERPLLVRVTSDASRVRADGEARLALLEAAVRVVAIAAPHSPFEHAMVKGQCELRALLRVAIETQLRLAQTQHARRGRIRVLPRSPLSESH